MSDQKHPWENMWKEMAGDSEILDIPEPPCKDCKNWKPQREFRFIPGKGQEYDGLRLCVAGDMYHDFSCFEEKIDVNKVNEK
jgi:hypothetical protein